MQKVSKEHPPNTQKKKKQIKTMGRVGKRMKTVSWYYTIRTTMDAAWGENQPRGLKKPARSNAKRKMKLKWANKEKKRRTTRHHSSHKVIWGDIQGRG